jgi:hypothetical protein
VHDFYLRIDPVSPWVLKQVDPEPERKIVSINFGSTKSWSSPWCVAITTEK